MARNITPDESDPNIEIGRFIHEQAYRRERKEISLGHIKIDILKRGGNEVIVGEVKKSSKFIDSARMQLLFYLHELAELGIEARGELLFPEERKRIAVELDAESNRQLEKIKAEILDIIHLPVPPAPIKEPHCTPCAYREICWA